MTHKRIESLRVIAAPDSDPDPSYLEQEGLGFEDRLRQYQNGQFSFIGVQAEAEISIWDGVPAGHGILQTISSPGLWGIEDDSEPSYFEEIGDEELATLRAMLEALGFAGEEFDSVEVSR